MCLMAGWGQYDILTDKRQISLRLREMEVKICGSSFDKTLQCLYLKTQTKDICFFPSDGYPRPRHVRIKSR